LVAQVVVEMATHLVLVLLAQLTLAEVVAAVVRREVLEDQEL
jgi:hypothetical protein